MDEELVKAVAIAMCKANNADPDELTSDVNGYTCRRWQAMAFYARQTIAAINAVQEFNKDPMGW